MIVSGSSLGSYVFGLIKSEAPESILPALYACLANVGSVNARQFASGVISDFGQ